MRIEKYTTIDDNIYEALRKKHPVKSEKGICYAQDMDYITLEVETFNDSVFRKLVKNDSKVLVVYICIRERMCHLGWYLKWDDTTKEDVIERLTLWGIKEADSEFIINTLIEKGVLKTFKHDNTEYLTDVQQIYNWEMLQAKRARDRKSKQNKGTQTDYAPNNYQTQQGTQDGFTEIPQLPCEDNYQPQENNFNEDGLPFR